EIVHAFSACLLHAVGNMAVRSMQLACVQVVLIIILHMPKKYTAPLFLRLLHKEGQGFSLARVGHVCYS
ncbi:MAG TPA: hypothetical protein PLR12_02080, partial [Clostridia bacterium]|nr:hypothetical protein [Clostridia bacterium]